MRQEETENKDTPFKVTIHAQREFVVDIAVKLKNSDQLVRLEDKLKKLGFLPVGKEETPAEKFEREMIEAEETSRETHTEQVPQQTAQVPVPQPTAPQGTGGQQLSNIAAGSAIPICPMHRQPMDRVTKTGVPYHSYKGQNCSGEGFWSLRPAGPTQYNG